MDYVNQLIAQAFEHVDKDTYRGKLGIRFVEMLEREKEKNKDQPIDSGLNEEFVRKVKFLSDCEKVNDFAWVDYRGWNTLSFEFQNLFVKLVDPLFTSSGVYFQYAKFTENTETLIPKLNTYTVILVMTDGACFQFACIGANSSIYNWMSSSSFKKVSADYRKRVILSMANSEKGIVIKTIERSKEENDE